MSKQKANVRKQVSDGIDDFKSTKKRQKSTHHKRKFSEYKC